MLDTSFPGARIYLNNLTGNDNNNGRSWASPIHTMGEALRRAVRGSVIYFYGKLREQGLVTPAGLTDVTILGCGTKVRGGHTGNTPGPKGGSTNWARTDRDSPVPLLHVTQQGWRFINLQLQGPFAGPSILLTRNLAGESDDPNGWSAGYAEFDHCVFVGPNQFGICAQGGVNHLTIKNCWFYNFYDRLDALSEAPCLNIAIGQLTGEGVGYPIMWEVLNNTFMASPKALHVSLSDSVVRGNIFRDASFVNPPARWLGPVMDVSGGGSNLVAENFLDCKFEHSSPFFKPGMNDTWGPNHFVDGTFFGLGQ